MKKVNALLVLLFTLTTMVAFQNCGGDSGSGSKNGVKQQDQDTDTANKVVLSEKFDGDTDFEENSELEGSEYGDFLLTSKGSGKFEIKTAAGMDDTKGLELFKSSVNLLEHIPLDVSKKYRITLYAKLETYAPNGAATGKRNPLFSVAILYKGGSKTEVQASKDVPMDSLEWKKYEVNIGALKSGNVKDGYFVNFVITSGLDTNNVLHVDNILVEQIL